MKNITPTDNIRLAKSQREEQTDMVEAVDNLNRNQENRLEFLEFRLFWEGTIRRGDLQQEFDISAPQATADFRKYQEIAKGNLDYDLKRSTYTASPEFKPVIYKPDARNFLTELRLISDHVIPESDYRLSKIPTFAVVPLVRRRASEAKLRKVVQAVLRKKAVYVLYQSMRAEEPQRRWIEPHALAFDGSRWHVRAWCHRRWEFRDFVLARMLEVTKDRDANIDTKLDKEWNVSLDFRIGPNPKLSKWEQAAVEYDYDMKGGETVVPCRVSLSWYLERHLGLDLDVTKLPAQRQQIVLLNRGEIEKTRKQAKAEAKHLAEALREDA